MRLLPESRQDFNETMSPYTAVIVKTFPTQPNDEFFRSLGLRLPRKRTEYTPPSWVGPTYTSDVLEFYKTGFRGMRKEQIPFCDPLDKYLLCDDYCCTGETLEIAMIRLMEQGVKLDNLWVFTLHGNSEIKDRVNILETGREWHNYHLRHISTSRRVLEELGFKFPEFPVQKII